MTPAAMASPATAPATEPPEARGIARDEVRLLVADGSGVRHARFADLPDYLEPGDLLVVNTSATLPAAVDGVHDDGRAVTVHFSTERDDGSWVVEVRPRRHAHGPLPGLSPGDGIDLGRGRRLTLRRAYPGAPAGGPPRFWTATLDAPDVMAFLNRHGRAISYDYVPRQWPLAAYQTMFARTPGSAEMPSAARPFTPRLVAALADAGVSIASVTLHAGVSSADQGEPPLPERYDVSPRTADRVNLALAAGRRVVAVGTTVTRALETVARPDGTVAPGSGWTSLVLDGDRPARVVGGLVTGWHAPGASHLRLLEAVAGGDLVRAAYAAAAAGGYLWHEFGDSCLLLPPGIRDAGTGAHGRR